MENIVIFNILREFERRSTFAADSASCARYSLHAYFVEHARFSVNTLVLPTDVTTTQLACKYYWYYPTGVTM